MSRKTLWYYRAVAAEDLSIGWPELPDAPMKQFVHMIALRAEEHPEKRTTSTEYRARVFSEAVWKSEKIDKINPPEWRSEYAWVYPVALADGTFEAAPKLVWSAAYACNRPDWDIPKVGLLLDELARVGLLERATDEEGKIWGRWVGSERFLPTEERSKRYKLGRLDLFNAHLRSNSGAPPEQLRSNSGLGVGFGVGVGSGKGEGEGLGFAAKTSENDKTNDNSKRVESKPSIEEPETVEPKNRNRKRPVLTPEEYDQKKTEEAVAQMAAEINARPRCPGCGIPHLPPYCTKKDGS